MGRMMHCNRRPWGGSGVSPSDCDAASRVPRRAGGCTGTAGGRSIATIVILQHELHRGVKPSFMVHALAAHWRTAGHRIVEHFGTGTPPPGDAAILHVDMTVVPQAYRDLCSRYPRVVNGGIPDASRRGYSQCLLARDSDWDGPVIAKTDANYGGLPEVALRLLAERAGTDSGIPEAPAVSKYDVFESLSAVPPVLWDMPAFIVEKFLPEPHPEGYFLRNCLFFGDRAFGYGGHNPSPVMKLRDMRDVAPLPVPAEVGEWRARLGCDFGSFDYALHAGRPVLFDVNRTPGLGPVSRKRLAPMLADLAAGLECFL